MEGGGESAGVLLELAELAHRRGEAERSIDLLRRAVELEPDSARAARNAMELAEAAGEEQLAARLPFYEPGEVP